MKSDASALVSVIIPVCNVEKYLAQCLESVCSQTHRELDIIYLNDDSKDGSLVILREFETRDSRVIVVDKPNEGYGATCNRGLEMAHGAWVSIIEPHYMRGFNYIHRGILDDGWENPIVQDGTRRVFSRMDTDIVLGHPKLSPKRKRFYLEQMGITGRRVPVWPRVRYFASEAAFSVKSDGVRGLVRKVGGFAYGKSVAARRAKENAKG